MRTLLLVLAICSAVMMGVNGCQPDGQVEYAAFNSLIGGGQSLVAFQTTLFPVVRAQCASCHGRSQTPLFAISDPVRAHSTALGLVNFTDPSLSKIYRKAADRHCGGACSTDGSAFLNAIIAWRDQRGTTADVPTAGIGNFFTHEIPVPARKAGCNLPNDLALPLVPGDPNPCWEKLRFPVSKMTAATGFALDPLLKRAWFEVDFSYEVYPSPDNGDRASYVFKNARLISPDGAAYIFDVKFFLNGKYQPEQGIIYSSIDKIVDKAIFDPAVCTVPSAPTLFNPDSIGANCRPSSPVLPMMTANIRNVIQKKVSPEQDTFSFSFIYLKSASATACKNIGMWETLVFSPIERGAVACLTCHREGGRVPEPARRFNMDPTDVANGVDRAARLATICQRFMQRSNFNSPDDSPILTQPTKGMNGMPPQDNFAVFSPDWRSWVLEEARLQR